MELLSGMNFYYYCSEHLAQNITHFGSYTISEHIFLFQCNCVVYTSTPSESTFGWIIYTSVRFDYVNKCICAHVVNSEKKIHSNSFNCGSLYISLRLSLFDSRATETRVLNTWKTINFPRRASDKKKFLSRYPL